MKFLIKKVVFTSLLFLINTFFEELKVVTNGNYMELNLLLKGFIVFFIKTNILQF